MARHLGVCLDAMDPTKGLLLFLLSFFVIGALLLCMARTKRVEPDSSPPESSSSRKRSGEGSSVDRGELRKKARNEARDRLIQERGVTCERYLDSISLTPRNEAVKIIVAHGMGFWFEPVEGYNLSMCREFYQKFRVTEVDGVEVLRTNVRGTVFVITPDEIATLLGHYKRPTSP